MKKFIAVAFSVLAAVGLVLADSVTTKAPTSHQFDSFVSVEMTNGVGTVSWTNDSVWASLKSASLVLTGGVSSATSTVAIVRTEGVTEHISKVDGDPLYSSRWSCVNDSDVILRYGDVVVFEINETDTAGQAYLSISR